MRKSTCNAFPALSRDQTEFIAILKCKLWNFSQKLQLPGLTHVHIPEVAKWFCSLSKVEHMNWNSDQWNSYLVYIIAWRSLNIATKNCTSKFKTNYIKKVKWFNYGGKINGSNSYPEHSIISLHSEELIKKPQNENNLHFFQRFYILNSKNTVTVWVSSSR